jgi:hypothetical protein
VTLVEDMSFIGWILPVCLDCNLTAQLQIADSLTSEEAQESREIFQGTFIGSFTITALDHSSLRWFDRRACI